MANNASSSSNSLVPVVVPESVSQDVNGKPSAGLENPSSVRNLKDLLKMTTQMVNAETDNFGSTDMESIEEKRIFLNNVLSTISVNVQEEMNNSINLLLDTNKSVEEHEYAFDVIEEYTDNIDYANDFQKLGGFQVFTPGLKSQHSTVRCKTAELIATLVQHNPYCQDKFMEEPSYINLLMSLVNTDPVDDVRVKALHALSGLVRHNVSAFWKFIDLGGSNLILEALKSSCNKLKTKAAFLVYSTCHMGNDVADMFVAKGLVEILCQIIVNMESLDDNYHELFLSALNQLLRMSPVKVKDICVKVENLNQALCKLRDSYPDDSTHQDEKDQILWLLETLTL
ncbi:uncharacterized protein LOC126844428 isoform X2 [Adelges cooleyi]|uniref:uncharacterized protein LOC126844428 isoform X2 n=1 Tax=Adelges cooleyi TaxID=133065 RepID=UPI00217F2427|nr:uncharacterized protein LOC126844428 isoform X2 [Adelges cooleyi]